MLVRGRYLWAFIVCVRPLPGLCGSLLAFADEGNTIRVAIVQMAISSDLETNCERMLRWVEKAARQHARVVVFPEGSLWTEIDDPEGLDQARRKLATGAAQNRVYLIFGESVPASKPSGQVQVARVIDPAGNTIFQYVKHYSEPFSPLPGIFAIDGVTAGAILCADRWLRTVEELPIQMGAQMSFELAGNFEAEWVPQLEWYWYVSRALRNNVWVIFANSARNAHGEGHGHSAIIAPDGEIVAALPDNREAMLVCDIAPALATRKQAQRRSSHPALKEFWTAGRNLYDGQAPKCTLQPFGAAPTEITLAATTVADDLQGMLEAIEKAGAEGADLLVFPARSCQPQDLPQLRAFARRHGVSVAVGIKPQHQDMRNRAVVIGSDGTLLTEYSQLSAEPPLEPGQTTQGMLFSLKGVPAILMVEGDILWTELIELAAVRGVQILVHLDRVGQTGLEVDRRQLQIWATAASFGMFSATASVNQASLWEDLTPRAERRSVIENRKLVFASPPEIYSAFSANMIVRTNRKDVIVAKRQLASRNNYFEDRVVRYPMLRAWLQWGAHEVFLSNGP